MNVKDAIKRIAWARGLTPEKVEEEIRIAIRDAMQTDDPSVRAIWRQIAPDGKEPSVEDFINYIVRQMDKRSGA